MGDISELVNISWPNHYREFLTGIWSCFLEKYKTDLEVYCSGHRVNVHQVVLAIFCPIFKQHQQEEGQDYNFCFNSPVGLEEADLGLLIEFLYRGKIKVSRDRLGIMREAGMAFGLQVLVDLIDQEEHGLMDDVPDEQLDIMNDQAEMKGKAKSEPADATKQENEPRSKSVDNIKASRAKVENDEVIKKKIFKSKRNKRAKENSTADPHLVTKENDRADIIKELEDDEEEEEEESEENRQKSRILNKKRDLKMRSSGGVRKPKQFLKCPHCNYGTSRKQLYLNHLDTHDRSVKRYVCEICSKAFRNNSSFGRHVYFHKNPDKLLRCTHCNYETMQRSVWLQHLAIRHQLDADGNPLKKDIQCAECDFVCITDYQLKSHVIRKHSTKSFKCDECDYCAVMRADLEKHVKIRHRNDRPYMCETCGYRSKTRSHFNCHLQMHTGIKPFKCQICGQAYTRSNKLKEHLRSHVSDEKPYLCHLCSYACRRKYNLTLHIKRIHKDGSVGKGRCPPRMNDEPVEVEEEDQREEGEEVEVVSSSHAVIQLQNMEPLAVMGEVSLTTVCMTGLDCLQPFNPLD